MDRRSSLGRSQISVSTTNLLSPLAESTHINGSNAHTKFPWGGKTSPLRSTAATSSSSSQQQLRANPRAAVSPVRRIDPRIYTDVQSKGLTSRIVKYHENSAKLNRSMSVGNLYTKPGEFPVVHLKKTEAQQKFKRSPSVSVVRIAPPERTSYHMQTRSSILRTGSMVAPLILDKADPKNSHADRPILLPAENDANPTRSVLDALKEISRKRINSDDVDCNDSIKKYCKESDEDIRRNVRLPLADVVTPTHVSVITKRQREIPSSTEMKSVSPESSTTKKRLCTKNNDISSSLSSSLLINTPKRKFHEIQGRPPIGRVSPSSSALTPPQAKQACNNRKFVETVDSNTSLLPNNCKYSENDFARGQGTVPAKSIDLPVEKQLPNQQAVARPKPKLTLFNKDYDTTEVVVKSAEEVRQPDEEGIAGISFVKPKKSSPALSGKNALIERVQTSKLSLMLSCLSGELDGSDDEVDNASKEQSKQSVTALSNLAAAAPSVAPATVTESSVPPNEPATSEPTTAVTAAPTVAFSFGLKSAAAPDSGTQATTQTSTKTAESVAAPVFNFGTVKSGEIASSASATPPTTTTASFTLAPVLQQPMAGFALPTTTTSTAPSTKPSDLPPPKFELSNAATADFTVSTVTTSSASSAPTFGVPASTAVISTSTPMFKPPTSLTFTSPPPPPSFASAIAQNQSKPMFSFGATTTSAVAAVATTTAPVNTFGSFTSPSKPPAYGAITQHATELPTTASSAMPQQQAIPTFGGLASSAFAAPKLPSSKFGETGQSFGSNLTAPTTTVLSFNASQQANAAPSTPVAMFGNLQSFGASTTTTSSATFNFGATAASKPAIGAAPKPATGATPAFSFNLPSSTTSTASSDFGAPPATTTSAFNFSASTTTPIAMPATQTASFNFGASQQPTTNVSSGFGFGGNATQPPVTTASSGFSFSTATQQQSTGFNFGGAIGTNQPAFAFGGGAAAANSTAQAQATKQISFGGSGTSAFTAVNNSSNNNHHKPASGGFSFNSAPSVANPASQDKNIFGTAAATVQTTKTFSFGAPSAASTADQQKTTNVFASNSAPPAFGASTMTPGKLFSFGAVPAADNISSSATANLFGGSTTTGGANTATPLFPAASNISNSQFGSAGNLAKSSFNFAATNSGPTMNNNNNSSSASAPFAFGVAKQDASKPFAFGASSTQPENVFGSNAATNRPAFNFSPAPVGGNLAINNNNLQGQGAADPNLNVFNPPRREIRTATRRLKPK